MIPSRQQPVLHQKGSLVPQYRSSSGLFNRRQSCRRTGVDKQAQLCLYQGESLQSFLTKARIRGCTRQLTFFGSFVYPTCFMCSRPRSFASYLYFVTSKILINFRFSSLVRPGGRDANAYGKREVSSDEMPAQRQLGAGPQRSGH